MKDWKIFTNAWMRSSLTIQGTFTGNLTIGGSLGVTGNSSMSGNVEFTGGSVKHGGKEIGGGHTHKGVQSGGSNSGDVN